MKKKVQLLAAFILCQSAGLFGTIFTSEAIPTWYQTLVKPTFQPPNWLFGPVWLILYTMMAVSLYYIWQNKKNNHSLLALFSIQLFLNAIWTPIFFGAKDLESALVIISTLALTIAVLIYKSWSVDKKIGLLLIPYLGWVCFATILNAAIFTLN